MRANLVGIFALRFCDLGHLLTKAATKLDTKLSLPFLPPEPKGRAKLPNCHLRKNFLRNGLNEILPHLPPDRLQIASQ